MKLKKVSTISGLPPDQHSFCHYLVSDPTMNKTNAYLKVRPDVKRSTAQEIARRWLDNPDLKAYLGELMTAREKRMEMDEDWVIGRLRDICDRCMQAEPVYDPKLGRVDDEGNPREPIYFKFDASGATKALELIGKHMRMFSDKVDAAQMNVSMSLDLTGGQVIEGEYKRVGNT